MELAVCCRACVPVHVRYRCLHKWSPSAKMLDGVACGWPICGIHVLGFTKYAEACWVWILGFGTFWDLGPKRYMAGWRYDQEFRVHCACISCLVITHTVPQIHSRGCMHTRYVWGRGALDIKFSVMALLEAVTQLLHAGYTPRRTLIFSFGHDEEVWGDSDRLPTCLHESVAFACLVLQQGGVLTTELFLACSIQTTKCGTPTPIHMLNYNRIHSVA